MRRISTLVALAAALFTLAACAPATRPGDSTGTTRPAKPAGTAAVAEPRSSIFIGKGGKTELFLHVVKLYDPAKFPKTSMDGEPSDVAFFKPEKDEGVRDRDYPAFDKKTFKFLALPTAAIPPQDHYMFQKDGGSLNKALKPLGYKAVDIIDTGHIKILPNLYTGYYDFAWVPLAVMTEYWSGNESMNQELWRDGNDYVIVGNSTDGDSSLMSPQEVPDIKQLDGRSVGIMNVSFNTEALLNKKLKTVGLSTAVMGGTVDVEMGSPGFIMNDLVSKKLVAGFSWSVYTKTLQKQFHYKELVPWQDLGYGKKLTNVVLVVRRDILAKHPDIVRKVVELNHDATIQAIEAGDYAKPAAARYQEWNDTYMGDGRRISDLGVPNLDPDVNTAYLKDVYDYMVDAGYFKTPYTFKELVNVGFLDKVKR